MRAAATPWVVVEGLAGAITEAGRRGGILVVDLENTIVAYGSSTGDRRRAIAAAVDAAASSGVVRHVAFVTNARFPLPTVVDDRLRVSVVTRARKPRVRRGPLRHLRSDLTGAAVYGDQPLTDGLLARNLRGAWLQPRHAHSRLGPEPWWPGLMRAVGTRFTSRWFAPPTAAAGPASDPAPHPTPAPAAGPA
jgi:predicted HAD superfamily phosphohydrolase YqeG